MEKIFDSNVQEYLKETGVSEKDINRIKYKKFKEGMLKIVSIVKDAIEQENYSLLERYVSYSGSGDGYGDENYYISFHSIVSEHDCGMDIKESFDYLQRLKVESK